MPISGADDPPQRFEISIAGGAVIYTPADIRLMTPYILLEQEDWFEEETAFLRGLLRPGETVIDIGANYGVYAASLAGAVGTTGRVLAIEPAGATAQHLSSTLTAYAQAQCLQSALGKENGEANLVIADNSETNHLIADVQAGQAVESVSLRRLDDVANEFDLSEPDFIKLDAEGAEIDILLGANDLLRNADPLIMFERKHGASVNTALIEALEEAGFAIFQLLPGPAVLAPYEPGRTDAFGLNLFAAKPGRIETLSESGHLISEWPVSQDHGNETLASVARLLREANVNATAVDAAGDSGAAVPRLLAFARVSRDLGLRQPAIDALGRALTLLQTGKAEIDSSALAADPTFDDTPPSKRDLTWLTASAITAYERARNYSSYYADQSTLPLLDRLRHTPHASPEMLRRRQLMQLRAGQRRRFEWETGFEDANVLNEHFWRGDVDMGL